MAKGINIADLKLGKDAARKLKKFEGERIYFKKYGDAHKAVMEKMNKEILKEKHKGMSKNEIRRIARKVGCTYNYAYYVIYSKKNIV